MNVDKIVNRLHADLKNAYELHLASQTKVRIL